MHPIFRLLALMIVFAHTGSAAGQISQNTTPQPVAKTAPQVLGTPKAIDLLAERLAGYAATLIEAEPARRVR